MITNFYTKPENIGKDGLSIEGEEARHILQVLRYKVGDLIDVVDGCGNKFRVNISRFERNRLEGRILSQVRKENEPITNLTLAQSICKGVKMDWVVEKSVELGVSCIIPLLTERSEVQFKNQMQEKNKIERWGRVATSAMKQSLRCFLPKVSQVTKLEDLLKNIKRYDLALMASLESRSRKLEDLSELKNRPKNVLLLVGPEAGFSSDELGEALGRGVFPVTLGARRLRSETAGVLFSSLVLYELKELA